MFEHLSHWGPQWRQASKPFAIFGCGRERIEKLEEQVEELEAQGSNLELFADRRLIMIELTVSVCQNWTVRFSRFES